ncbi:hypothetical protein J6590_037059 [Homalodisca vitripennis]|nr:hypothetical protein J6590_037059 [Homalodisca vitripennis]
MPGEDMDMQIDESPPIDRRWRPTRLCVLVVAIVILVVLLYWGLHNDSPIGISPSHVSVFLDNSGPYSLTVGSDMDVVQELDQGKTRVEISVRELLENKTKGPVRIVRSDGER